MTLDDVLDLHDYWADHPPVQWMVQSYLGIKPRNTAEAPKQSFADFVKSLSPPQV